MPDVAGYALIVGRLAAAERYKGHDRLIQDWPRLMHNVPDARLIVVGDGDDRPRLQSLAAERGLADVIRFAGRVSVAALEGYYQRAAFFVMPSTGEGFGLAYLEAMRAGRACVAAPGAAAEIVEDGVSGLIVDPARPGELFRALLRLFQDQPLSAALGRAGAARVACEFEPRHFSVRLITELNRVAALA